MKSETLTEELLERERERKSETYGLKWNEIWGVPALTGTTMSQKNMNDETARYLYPFRHVTIFIGYFTFSVSLYAFTFASPYPIFVFSQSLRDNLPYLFILFDFFF